MEQPLASDLSLAVLQLRRKRGELSAVPVDRNVNQRLLNVPSLIAQREAYLVAPQSVEEQN